MTVWTGCRTDTSGAIGNVSGETSVAPAINESFRGAVDVEEWVKRFERDEREVYAQRAEIVKAAQIWRDSTVADIGAGTGAFTKLLSEAVGPKGKVFAVDVVPEFLLYLKQRMVDEGVTNVEAVLCGERSVDLPENSVDLAFMCDVYHHLEYPRATLASLRKALRPGGRLVLVDFKRIEDESSDWVLEHIRAGQEVFTREIVGEGFKKESELDFMKENYFVTFRKLER